MGVKVYEYVVNYISKKDGLPKTRIQKVYATTSKDGKRGRKICAFTKIKKIICKYDENARHEIYNHVLKYLDMSPEKEVIPDSYWKSYCYECEYPTLEGPKTYFNTHYRLIQNRGLGLKQRYKSKICALIKPLNKKKRALMLENLAEWSVQHPIPSQMGA